MPVRSEPYRDRQSFGRCEGSVLVRNLPSPNGTQFRRCPVSHSDSRANSGPDRVDTREAPSSGSTRTRRSQPPLRDDFCRDRFQEQCCHLACNVGGLEATAAEQCDSHGMVCPAITNSQSAARLPTAWYEVVNHICLA